MPICPRCGSYYVRPPCPACSTLDQKNKNMATKGVVAQKINERIKLTENRLPTPVMPTKKLVKPTTGVSTAPPFHQHQTPAKHQLSSQARGHDDLLTEINALKQTIAQKEAEITRLRRIIEEARRTLNQL